MIKGSHFKNLKNVSNFRTSSMHNRSASDGSLDSPSNCNASNKLKFHEYKAGFPHRDLTFPSGIVKAIVHVRACAPSADFSKPSEFNRGLAAARAAQTSCGLAETYSQQYTNKPCARLRFSILNAPEFCGRIRRPDSVEVCFGPALSISLWAAAVHGLCVFPN